MGCRMDDSAQEQKWYTSNRRIYQVTHLPGVAPTANMTAKSRYSAHFNECQQYKRRLVEENPCSHMRLQFPLRIYKWETLVSILKTIVLPYSLQTNGINVRQARYFCLNSHPFAPLLLDASMGVHGSMCPWSYS
jgi:hypothetical protein